MVATIDHPMSREELEALIKQLDVQTNAMRRLIVERWGSVTKARIAKKNGDLKASNFLRERSRLLTEKRDWQKGLNALLPKHHLRRFSHGIKKESHIDREGQSKAV